MIFDSVNLTCASGEMEALLKDQSEQPDVQMKEQVKTDNQSEEQQASVNIICDSVKESKKQLCEQQTVQLMKEVRRSVSSVSAKPKHDVTCTQMKPVVFYVSTAGTNAEGIIATSAAEQESAGGAATGEEESSSGMLGCDTDHTSVASEEPSMLKSIAVGRMMALINTKPRFYGSRE